MPRRTLISSLLWAVIICIDPIRSILENLSSSILTDILSLLRVPLLIASPASLWFERLVLVLLAVAGFALTVLILRFVPEKSFVDFGLHNWHSGDNIRKRAIPVTAFLLVVALLLQTLEIEQMIATFFILVGLNASLPRREVIQPEPDELPGDTESNPTGLDDESIREDNEDQENYLRSFSWHYNEEPYLLTGRNQKLSLGLRIPKALHARLKELNHNPRSEADYVLFSGEELGNEVVTSLSSRIRHFSNQLTLDRLGEIHLAMSFTLSLQYASDLEDYGVQEYPKFPSETLVDKRGDCEDHAIVCGAVLCELGYNVCLGFTKNHAFLGVEAPKKIPGVSFYLPEVGKTVYCAEVTPGVTDTTQSPNFVQFWLGAEPHGGTSGARFFPIVKPVSTR